MASRCRRSVGRLLRSASRLLVNGLVKQVVDGAKAVEVECGFVEDVRVPCQIGVEKLGQDDHFGIDGQVDAMLAGAVGVGVGIAVQRVESMRPTVAQRWVAGRVETVANELLCAGERVLQRCGLVTLEKAAMPPVRGA